MGLISLARIKPGSAGNRGQISKRIPEEDRLAGLEAQQPFAESRELPVG